MLFSELYSAYYNAVAAVLRAACARPVGRAEMRALISENAFGESVLNMEPALREERWQLLLPDGSTPLRHPPTMPLTALQKRWLKAIALDPRIRLFTDDLPDFPGVEPLFRPGDIQVFDRYLDGDPYEDDAYVRRFRLVLQAVRDRTPLEIFSLNRKGRMIRCTLMPEYLEYSEKDDKFRLVGSGSRCGRVVNLGRIIRCSPATRPFSPHSDAMAQPEKAAVELELWDRRNALERVLMHFAHLEKQAEKLGRDHYRLTLTYDKSDETEMIIRILSFGPMVRVTAPADFLGTVKARLAMQKSCGP